MWQTVGNNCSNVCHSKLHSNVHDHPADAELGLYKGGAPRGMTLGAPHPESWGEEGSVGWCWIHVSLPLLHCPLFLFLSFPSLSLSSSSPSLPISFFVSISTSHLLLKRVHIIVCTLFGHRPLSLVGLQQGSALTSQLLFLDTIQSLKKH